MSDLQNVRIDVAGIDRVQKRELVAALRRLLARQPSRRWTLVVRPTLLYQESRIGTWWWRLLLTPRSGKPICLISKPNADECLGTVAIALAPTGQQ